MTEPPPVVVTEPQEPEAPPATTLMDIAEYHALIKSSRLEFNTLEMDGSAATETPDEQISFTFKIRMVRDSAIWIQLKKLGLEGVRILANQQGITYIDRLHRTYSRKSWDDLRKELKADINFTLMQDILTGNAPHDPGDPVHVTYNNDNILLTSGDGNEARMLVFNWPAADLKLLQVSRPAEQQLLTVKINDKKVLYDNIKFSYLRDLEILSNNKKQLYVSLEFDEVKRNTTFSIPFEIPSNYREAD